MADSIGTRGLNAKTQGFERFLRVNRARPDGLIRIRPSAIYILPTGFGLIYGLLCLLLLIGAMNYANNLGFLLTFFLGGVGLVSMIYCWRNLQGLRLRTLRVQPIFAGQEAHFLFLPEEDHRTRPDLELRQGNDHLAAIDAWPDSVEPINLKVRIPRRGPYRLGRCILSTRYPMGLFRSWTYLEPAARCLVYPRPEAWPYQALGTSSEEHEGAWARRDSSGLEYHGLRPYQPGDPLRSIHWRSLAKGDVLMSREYESSQGDDLWFDLDQTPGPDLERRLSQLCHAVLDAGQQQRRFGLRLGPHIIKPGLGEGHQLRALTMLAEFGQEAQL